MHLIRYVRAIVVIAAASCCLLPRAALADTLNFALVRCDEATGELEVKEDSTEEASQDYRPPLGYESKWLDKLVSYISPPGGASDDAVNGTIRRKRAEWQLTCVLRGARYQIVISPWSENDMVMGECGGGDPHIELTVRRNKRVLIDKLRLGGGCAIGPASPPLVLSAKLSEAEQVTRLDNTLRIPFTASPLGQKSIKRIMEGAHRDP